MIILFFLRIAIVHVWVIILVEERWLRFFNGVFIPYTMTQSLLLFIILIPIIVSYYIVMMMLRWMCTPIDELTNCILTSSILRWNELLCSSYDWGLIEHLPRRQVIVCIVWLHLVHNELQIICFLVGCLSNHHVIEYKLTFQRSLLLWQGLWLRWCWSAGRASSLVHYYDGSLLTLRSCGWGRRLFLFFLVLSKHLVSVVSNRWELLLYSDCIGVLVWILWFDGALLMIWFSKEERLLLLMWIMILIIVWQ